MTENVWMCVRISLLFAAAVVLMQLVAWAYVQYLKMTFAKCE